MLPGPHFVDLHFKGQNAIRFGLESWLSLAICFGCLGKGLEAGERVVSTYFNDGPH